MTITMDRTFGLLKARESACRKRQQAGLLFFPEQLADFNKRYNPFFETVND